MHIFPAIILISSVASATSTGQRLSSMALTGLFQRQVQVCASVPAPATCASSCGPGNVQCISFPHCYNPSKGESCCSDGTYCPAGNYCTNAGCCPDGTSLAECGATVSLSVIPPPAASTSAATTESTSSPAAITSSTTTGTTSSTTTAAFTETSISTAPSALPTTAGTVPSSNVTVTAFLPAQFTASTGQRLDHNVVCAALGGLSLLLLLL